MKSFREWVKGLVQRYPFIAVAASAAAGYYGGPTGAAWLAKVWGWF